MTSFRGRGVGVALRGRWPVAGVERVNLAQVDLNTSVGWCQSCAAVRGAGACVRHISASTPICSMWLIGVGRRGSRGLSGTLLPQARDSISRAECGSRRRGRYWAPAVSRGRRLWRVGAGDPGRGERIRDRAAGVEDVMGGGERFVVGCRLRVREPAPGCLLPGSRMVFADRATGSGIGRPAAGGRDLSFPPTHGADPARCRCPCR